jgi:biotin carboxylase
MTRVLILATTTGYQTRAFGEAAERLGVELVFATDRCHLIEDPWQDGAVAIRFYDQDASVAAILAAAADRPIDGIVVVGDRPAVIAAGAAQALGIPWHPPDAAAIAIHKLRTRERLRAAGLPVPWWHAFSLSDRSSLPAAVTQIAGAQSLQSPNSPIPSLQSPQSPTPNPQSPPFPCVLKPAALSGSRGVMRADNADQLSAAVDRLRTLMQSPDVRAERNEAHDTALVEGFIPGREYAIEALMHHGALHVLAIFDKPDPLDGPFFEETIYLTPSTAAEPDQRALVDAVTRAAAAIGLRHGPVHAECRLNANGVFVLEVAPRPIGGLCARALRFAPISDDAIRPITSRQFPQSPQSLQSPQSPTSTPQSPQSPTPNPQSPIPFEELLLRHALGDAVETWRREDDASGVMMIPIPRRGIYRGVDGVDAARAVPHVDDVRITAKPDQLLIPLPEGASYLGFVFARAAHRGDVERALRDAHARLTFHIAPEFPVLSGGSINYNHQHG